MLAPNEWIDYNGSKRTERAPDFAPELPSDFKSFHDVMQDAGPQSEEKFLEDYNDPAGRKKLEREYWAVGNCKVDIGHATNKEIAGLDGIVFEEKCENFNNKLKNRGNIAGAYIDGNMNEMYYGHSKISKYASSYTGKSTLVLLSGNRRYKYMDVQKADGGVRTNTFLDTEAKLIEYFAALYEVRPFHSITMYSERGMCPSCMSVVRQFMAEHPGVQVTVISNRRGEGNVWEFRTE